jgi:hypothetical protein
MLELALVIGGLLEVTMWVSCYLFISGLGMLLQNLIQSYKMNGVIKVSDLVIYVFDERGEEETIALLTLINLPILAGFALILSPFIIVFYLVSRLNLITKFLENHSDKELVSTKRYKIKKLLYEKN